MPHLTAGEHWLLTRATAVANKIVIDSVDAATGVFTAHYATIANPSVFTGQLYAREGSLLTLLQRDASTGYTAAHVAVAGFDDSGWTGTWGEVTGAQVETFAMTRSD